MNLRSWMFGLVALMVLVGCRVEEKAVSGSSESGSEEKSFVAFAQANSADPWRQVFDADMKAEAEKHPEMSFELQTAQDDANKQIDIIETFLTNEPKPKVLLVSAADKSVASAIEKAFDQGVPVILLDRGIDGDKFTTLIGGDNVEIGRAAAKYLAEQLKNNGTVLMIRGKADASATIERTEGAMEVWKGIPGIKVMDSDHCDYQREKARSYMETFLQGGQHIDAIYAHNDEMAIGAYLAWEAWDKSQPLGGKRKRPLIVGIDACQVEIVDYIQQGKIDATFKYPNPGPKGIQVAAEILGGKKDFEKKIVLPTEIVTKDNAGDYLANNPKLHK